MKTQWQANPAFKNELQIAKSMYKVNGMREFYAGSIANFSRIVVKYFYRFPLMVQLPHFYSQRLPDSIRQNKMAQKFCTAMTISLIESFILCPFERIKTYFMTVSQLAEGAKQTEGKVGFKTFVAESDHHLFKSLFKGMLSLYIR